MAELIDRTSSWDGQQRFAVLAGTSMDAWRCPACGSALALTGVLKSPRNRRYRVRLECSNVECGSVDLVARIGGTLFVKLAGIRMRNVVGA